jgi:hypothetical protein
MAKLQITVRRKGRGRLVAHETFEISRELAQELIAKMEAMIAELSVRHRTTRTIRPDGAGMIEIELNQDVPPPIVHPNFEELFRQRRHDDPR